VQEALEAAPEHLGLVSRAIRDGKPLYLPSVPMPQLEQAAVSTEHLEALRTLELSSVICIPLRARGLTLGGLVFAHERARSFSTADYEVATELGRRSSVAIENGMLLEQSFEREAEVSRKNEALQLIADAGVALSSTLEMSESLTALGKLVVPRFADVCSISLMQDSKLEPVARATSTEALDEAMAALSKAGQPDEELFHTASQVLRSNRPIYFPTIPPELYERLAPSEAAEEALAGVSLRSMIIMPLSAREQTLGVMTFLRTAKRPPFDRQDLSLAGQIARRTAVSADNGRLYADARRANDAKDEFLGMMSHELRTPITVIHGGARVLRARAAHLDEDTRNGLLGDIERESERLSRMLENLLALARAELDREVMLEPVLLQRLIPRLVASVRSATGREVSLESVGELPAVSAEPAYIEHIVRNLVGNAVKYSPADSPIDVCLQPEGPGASIRVRDRGFGIAADESSRIFERFYRSDRTSRLAGGAGLGLAVCKRLVEAMAGEIWATPREGGGLEVGFSLPPYREENIEV
jgi:signal transduction histidine kinase